MKWFQDRREKEAEATKKAIEQQESAFFGAFKLLSMVYNEKSKLGPNRATRRLYNQLAIRLLDEAFQSQCLSVWRRGNNTGGINQ